MMMDEAEVIVRGFSRGAHLYIDAVSSQCYKCDQVVFSKEVFNNQSLSMSVDSRWPVKFYVFRRDMSTKGITGGERFERHFVEYGKYNLDIVDNSNSFKITWETVHEPKNIFLPFIVFVSVLFGFAVLWPLTKYIRRRYKNRREDGTKYFVEMAEWDSKLDSVKRSNSETQSNTDTQARKTKRLRSLDAFRGIAIVLMIFVNNSGGHYYFIDHAVWNGLTVADLVFPWFIFIMGTSINLSYKSFLKRGERMRTALFQIFWRSIKLFVIGVALNQGKSLLTWRIPGVLQRFGVCYFVVASLNFITSPSQEKLLKWKGRPFLSPFRDILAYWLQWLFIILIIAAHTAITFLLPVPGCPKGYLGPGGLAENSKFFNCTGGAAGYIDRYVLGNNHIYGYPTCKKIYRTTQHFDPEGILGFLPSIVSTFLGLQAGRILFAYDGHSSRIRRWLTWTVLTGAIGFSLTLASRDEGIIPINKNLWSLSYVLVTAATSFLLFVICYVTCDVYHAWNGSPFFFCGMNAIFLYVGHMLIAFRVFWHDAPQSHGSYLVVATFNTLIWVTWAFVLYKKKIFFTV